MTRPAWRCNVAELLLDDRRSQFAGRPALRSPDRAWSREEIADRVGALAGGLRARRPPGRARRPRHAGPAAVGDDVSRPHATRRDRGARKPRQGRLPPAAFAEVGLAVSAGEPLPGAVWHAVRDVLGLELVDGLGSSEATNLYISNRPGRGRPGSVGSVVPGFDLRVVDDDGRDVAAGTPGELLVRGASVMTGYLGAPEATERALRAGWLHTGDLVVRETDATYRFACRIGERFKNGGFWVDPARVEAMLHRHPGVAEVAVSGARDAGAVAIVVPRYHADTPALRGKLEALAASELAPHEAPRDYVFVDRLATSASGKVRRRDLEPLATGTPEAEVVG